MCKAGHMWVEVYKPLAAGEPGALHGAIQNPSERTGPIVAYIITNHALPRNDSTSKELKGLLKAYCLCSAKLSVVET